MKQLEAEELLSCLPAGRTLFTYGRDWYAVSLLQLAARYASMDALRGSHFANLFTKPRLRAWLGAFGKKSVTPADLALIVPDDAETYRLTAGLFDGWTQSTRRGSERWQIVLQLNLNEDHTRRVSRHFPECDPFEYRWHPVHGGRHRTLAWCRIDLDWECGEALIEEVQTDRIRMVRKAVERVRQDQLKEVRVRGQQVDAEWLMDYWDRRLRISRQCWDEAMLCAAIRFIACELGIHRIFYHSPISGARLKGGGAENAPGSLYTDLPKRFCFERTEMVPSFVRRRRKHASGLWMHRMCLKPEGSACAAE
jgi:hypothetical protein